MLRKLMSVIALCSVPVLSFGVAQLATSANASAAKGGTTTCGGTPGAKAQKVKFAKPGISNQGTASASSTSASKTTAGSITCTGGHKGTGTVAASKVTTTSTTTCASDANPPSPCPSGDYVYDSVAELIAGGSTLYQGVPTTSFKIGSTAYVIDNTASKTAPTGSGPGNCPSGETGFVLTGHVATPASQSGEASTITTCFSKDTGTNTTGNFYNDVVSEAGGNKTIVIATAQFDPTTSSIQFS